jgi:hypothetical protein
VPRDIRAAVEWYRKAAAQRNAEAQYNLGLCYENGEGVAKGMSTAAGWYRKAAAQGQAEAQYNLGVFYEKGWGVIKDMGTAVELYRKAAAQGHAQAQFLLGTSESACSGDMGTAVEWLRKAAAQVEWSGHTQAQAALRAICADGAAEQQAAFQAATRAYADVQEALLRNPGATEGGRPRFRGGAAAVARATAGHSGSGGSLISDGARVRLGGLQSEAGKAHNGKTGVAGKFDGGRFQVVLEDGFCGKFRPENLQLISSGGIRGGDDGEGVEEGGGGDWLAGTAGAGAGAKGGKKKSKKKKK